mgnify:CR=1 FL=1
MASSRSASASSSGGGVPTPGAVVAGGPCPDANISVVVGADKATYALVPDMIRFYLDEEPLLEQVPTDLCHKPGKVEEVIARLDERVVKPVDGYGGAGITIGPECSPAELDERAEQLRVHPDHFIAQDIVRLSTLPTAFGDASCPFRQQTG